MAAWFENGKIVTNADERLSSLDFTKLKKADDPLQGTQMLLQTKLKGWFSYTRGVCFAYEGK